MRCWASLWTARAITYRQKQGIAPDDVALAVVVQQQIAADSSGVAFSLDPQNNCYDEAVINTNFGLGETVVAGEVTPDSFVVEKFFQQLRAIDLERDLPGSLRARREQAHAKLLALAEQKGKAKKFRRLVDQASYYGYREAPKYLLVALIDQIHRRALEFGEQFVAQGRLDAPADIFDLHLAEVSRAQADSELPLRPLIAEHRAARERFDRVREWPRAVDSRGRIFRLPPREAKPGELAGDPISPGVVRGRANVLKSPYEKPLVVGDILVTRATDPGWTPLFMNAAGVVLEVGGSLTHGAVIAREYGLPCVSGVEGAVDEIPDAAMIEVDGSSGIIRLLDDEGTERALALHGTKSARG